MTRVAAANPFAWFPGERSAEELVHPTAETRMVGSPYTKYTVSIMAVALAGAVIVASHEAADRLGVVSVPAIVANGRLSWAGSIPEPAFVERLLLAADST